MAGRDHASLDMDAATFHPEWWLNPWATSADPPNVRRLEAEPRTGSRRPRCGPVEDLAGWVGWMAKEPGSSWCGDAYPRGPPPSRFDLFGIDEPSPVSRQVLESYVAGEQAAHRVGPPPNVDHAHHVLPTTN